MEEWRKTARQYWNNSTMTVGYYHNRGLESKNSGGKPSRSRGNRGEDAHQTKSGLQAHAMTLVDSVLNGAGEGEVTKH